LTEIAVISKFAGLRGNGACCSFADAVACLTALERRFSDLNRGPAA
jgi:hypothetical protein